MAVQRIGGTFAPPLTPQKLGQYITLSESAPEEVRGYMEQLISMMEALHKEDKSSNPSSPHPSGIGTITMLEDDQISRLFDVTPWPRECNAMQECFEELPPGDLRNAAFHLLWYGKELSEDRQPLTNDRLPRSPRRAMSEKQLNTLNALEEFKTTDHITIR